MAEALGKYVAERHCYVNLWRPRRCQTAEAITRLQLPATIYITFYTQRHLISRNTLRRFRAEAMEQWKRVTAAA
jgi:hypothetical protein